MRTTSGIVSTFAAISFFSESPSTYSMAMYIRRSHSSTAKIVAMFGWLSRAAVRASRRKRAFESASPAISSFSSLTATMRSRLVSSAFHTSPMPP